MTATEIFVSLQLIAMSEHTIREQERKLKSWLDTTIPKDRDALMQIVEAWFWGDYTTYDAMDMTRDLIEEK